MNIMFDNAEKVYASVHFLCWYNMRNSSYITVYQHIILYGIDVVIHWVNLKKKTQNIHHKSL